MEIAFHTISVRQLCEDQSKAAEAFGTSTADALRRRLADIRAAQSILDVPLGSPLVHEADSARVSVSLGEANVLELRQNHPKRTPQVNGRVDWSRVQRVMVISIGRAS